MKKTLFVVFYCLASSSGKGLEIEYPVKDESLARVLMLFEAEFSLLYEGDPKLAQYQEAKRTVGYQDFPAFMRFLEDKELPYNNWSYQLLISYVSKIDGSNMRSTGDSDMMRLTREFLTVKSEKPDWQSVALCTIYLSQKGDARDLPLLAKYSTSPSNLDFAKYAAQDSLRILQARVAGSNLLTNLPNKYDHYCWSTNEPPFLPSVANTGPQAAYVYDLLKQALAKYGSATNIPPELATMVVTFGADGKPVSNVDLAQYGLDMPEFALPLSPTHDVTNAAAVPPQLNPLPSTVPAASEPQPSRLSRPAIPLAVGTGIIAVLLLWCGLRKKKP